jgi:molecular chaperone Hsp33
MAESSSSFAPHLSSTVVNVDFVRHRNVMLVQADLSPLLVDYYLHLADHGLKHPPEQEALLRRGLIAFTLHCAARPRGEHLAWTISLQQPRLNLFYSGDNEDCQVIGRLFTENVREAARNVFYSELVPNRGAEKRRSVINFEGTDLYGAAETYYAVSEQRPARFFELGEDRCALLLSHPDCDGAWLRQITSAGVNDLARQETLTRVETRTYQWYCGCNQQKILGALAPLARTDLQELFGESEMIHVQCPRCGARHNLTRETMEAFLARTGQPDQ